MATALPPTHLVSLMERSAYRAALTARLRTTLANPRGVPARLRTIDLRAQNKAVESTQHHDLGSEVDILDPQGPSALVGLGKHQCGPALSGASHIGCGILSW